VQNRRSNRPKTININGVDSSSSFQQAASYGLIGAGAAIVGSILVDSIGNANNKLSQTPVDGLLFGRKVLALQITLDDKREINLPLMEAQVISPFYITIGHPHEVGRRVQLAHNQKQNNIQVLNPSISSVPVKGDSDYEKACELRIDKDLADAVIKSSKHIVDESLIIGATIYSEYYFSEPRRMRLCQPC
jgi:hypothetical protein